jgi:hypothetical protein
VRSAGALLQEPFEAPAEGMLLEATGGETRATGAVARRIGALRPELRGNGRGGSVSPDGDRDLGSSGTRADDRDNVTVVRTTVVVVVVVVVVVGGGHGVYGGGGGVWFGEL